MPENTYVDLRVRPSGGAPRKYVAGSEGAFQERRRLVLLVHGYNVSARQAQSSFQEFEDNLALIAPELQKDCCWVYWPGDSPVPVLRPLAYWRKVQLAQRCAGELAAYVRKRVGPEGEPTDIIVVGHSLGCRLILEALSSLEAEGMTASDLSIRVILMAAAVPYTSLERSGLREGLLVAQECKIAFSEADTVLRRYFPLGQLIARDGIPPLEAVGLRGLPLDAWDTRQQFFGYDHGDYWSQSGAAEVIANWISHVPVPQPHRSQAARPPVDGYNTPERQLPDHRSIQQRSLDG